MDRHGTVVAAVLLAACNGGSEQNPDGGMDDASIDAAKSGPCWLTETTPGGEVELGTGYSAYQPMGDSSHLVFGDQQGYHFEVRARLRGLDPGDPVDILNPKNPRTRYRAYFVDTGEPIAPLQTCGVRLGYVPASDGDGVVSPTYIEARFDTSLTGADIFNKQYRVVVEVIDSTGKYATAEKIVTALPPQ